MAKKMIVEMTRYDLLRAASPEPWKHHMSDRIKGYTIKFSKILLDREKEKCEVCFDVYPPPGHTQQRVYINLVDFWDIYDENVASERQLNISSVVNLVVMHGILKVYCSCPAWLYGGYKYIATELDYAYHSEEGRFPKIRNPKLLGTLCKHAFVVVKALPYQKFAIEAAIKRELKKQGGVI